MSFKLIHHECRHAAWILACVGLSGGLLASKADSSSKTVDAGNIPLAAPARPGTSSSNVLFKDMLEKIAARYYKPERIIPPLFIRAALNAVESVSPEIIVEGPTKAGMMLVRTGSNQMEVSTTDARSVIDVGKKLHEVLLFIIRSTGRVAQNMDLQRAMFAAILETLDQYSRFYHPRVFRKLKESLMGYTVGVGMDLKKEGDRILISRITFSSPASNAGIQRGDQLVRVAHLLMADLTPYVATSALYGKPGSHVDVWILRKGWRRPRRFRLVRKEVVLPSVESRRLVGDIGYIKITDFKENTAEIFRRQMSRIGTEGRQPLKGLILDLRGNGGGFVDVSVNLANLFLNNGVILMGSGAPATPTKIWKASPAAPYHTIPLVVLTDRESASAAEILAGALQKSGRALLMGMRTWGKGTVQELEHLSDGGAYKFTTLQYLLADGAPVQTTGVIPDVLVSPVRIRSDLISVFQPMSREGPLLAEPGSTTDRKNVRIEQPGFVTKMIEDRSTGDLIQLARDLLLAGTSCRTWKTTRPRPIQYRKALLDSGMDVLIRSHKRQEKLISARLNALGIDWSAPPDPSDPSGRKGYKILLRLASHPQQVTAGAMLKLKLFVKNLTQHAIHRVGGIVRSPRAYLNGREMVIGRLEPNESREAEILVLVPQDLVSHTAFFKVEAVVAEKPTKRYLSDAIWVRGLPRPRFRFAWQIDDRREGNGDGILQPGESADLLLTIQNEGGHTLDAFVEATYPRAPLVLNRARVHLPSFGGGQSCQARLQISLPASANLTRLQRDFLGLSISVFDRYLGRTVGQEILLPVNSVKTAFEPFLPPATARPIATEVTLLNAARASAVVIARAGPKALLPALGRTGQWLMVELGNGWPAFVPAAEVSLSKPAQPTVNPAGAAAPPSRDPPDLPPVRSCPRLHFGVTLDLFIKPPEIVFKNTIKETTSESIRIEGEVSHWNGVMDLWVERFGLDIDPIGKNKLLYTRVSQGPDAAPVRRFPFKLLASLYKGSNLITVHARSRNGIEAFSRLAVYRMVEPKRTETVVESAASMKKRVVKKASKARSRCGCCSEGPRGSPFWLFTFLLLLLGFGRRRFGMNGKRTG